MSVVEITDQDFQQKVLESKAPVLLDLYAVWCGPCKAAEPILEKLSQEYEGRVSFVKLDVDKNISTAQKLGVMSIPTTILFKGGKEVGRQVGFSGKKAFEELISKRG